MKEQPIQCPCVWQPMFLSWQFILLWIQTIGPHLCTPAPADSEQKPQLTIKDGCIDTLNSDAIFH